MQSFAGSCAAKITIRSSTCRSGKSERDGFMNAVGKGGRLGTNFAITTNEQATSARIYLVICERVDFEFLEHNCQCDGD
jgi:hypothetical protein